MFEPAEGNPERQPNDPACEYGRALPRRVHRFRADDFALWRTAKGVFPVRIVGYSYTGKRVRVLLHGRGRWASPEKLEPDEAGGKTAGGFANER